MRTIGWLAAAVLTLAALGAPAGVLAEHTIDLGESGTDQSGLCQGDYFKVESTAWLEAGTHTYTGTTDAGVAFTAVLTVELDEDDEVATITVVSTDPAYALIVFKAGTVFSTTGGSVVVDANGKAISNIAFCGLVEQTEPTPTPTPTAEASPTPTPTGEASPTPTPEDSVGGETATPEASPTPTPTGEATPTPTPTPTPEDSVGGETDSVTLPPTDTGAPASSAPASNTWRMILLAMGALIATALLLTPQRRTIRRD